MNRLAVAINRAHLFLCSPGWRKFFIYLGLLWILNIIDSWQTLSLKISGQLASEANQYINYLLNKGPVYFISFKMLAIILVTMILVRGYFDSKGIKLGDTFFTTNQVRTAIQFMLILANIYYLFVVYIPLTMVLLSYRTMYV